MAKVTLTVRVTEDFKKKLQVESEHTGKKMAEIINGIFEKGLQNREEVILKKELLPLAIQLTNSIHELDINDEAKNTLLRKVEQTYGYFEIID